LNKETLEDENNIKEDKQDEKDVKWNVLHYIAKDSTNDAMDYDVNDEISNKPCEIILSHTHSHDFHALSNFFLNDVTRTSF
jgi:hypothetical protein